MTDIFEGSFTDNYLTLTTYHSMTSIIKINKIDAE